MQLSDKGKAAIKLVVKGWAVFPLQPNGKAPMVKNWEREATTDPIVATSFWTSWPDANIGLATGESDLVVIDFDSAKGPDETSGIENFRKAYSQKLTDTYTVRTPSGGWHLYYRAGDNNLRNSAGRLAPKIDTRAQGGYVVAPGSTIDGGAYVVTKDATPQLVPAWVLKALEDKPVVRSTTVIKGSTTAYAKAALVSECTRVRETTEGSRNHATNRAAWNVSRFVAKGELDYEEARSVIIAAAEACGLSKREASHATASGLQRGTKYYASR